ncbi:hypothetical protein BLFGPEAP_01201 [Candidatus Methanoperedenaceae archaeon GB50]|nr:hypothetical protein BLFGPEAP_01201 [Candidatus Methanoperedenaceae archaeon GB50]
MTWKQLVAMGGVFYLTFVSLCAYCPAGDKFVIVAVSAFFTFLVVKSFVYTLEMWKAKKAGVDIRAELRKSVEDEIKNDDDVVTNPAFAELPCNIHHGIPGIDRTASWDDDDSHGNPIWPEDER